jgi:hypothetical protein
MTSKTIRPGARSALFLMGLISAGGAAYADDASGPPVKPECAFPCFFHSSDPAPAPAPQAAAAETAPVVPAPEAGAPVAKPARKIVHALTIAADEAQASRLKALTGVVPGQPVKIVKAQAAAADFTVKAALPPASDTPKARDAKLFTEQLHIIANDKIARVEDLRDRVVSFGTEGSAGQDAARKAFQALGVPVKETPLDLDNALDGAATGDVDAVVVLAPQPFDRLKGASRSGLHLLSWPETGALPAGAVDTTISADAYPGLVKPGETIRAVGVDAVLHLSTTGAKQPATKRFLSALAQHSANLSKRGFDLLKADLDSRAGSRVASAEKH